MKKEILELLKTQFSPEELLLGEYGIEREGLRVDAEGRLALTPHPKVFGPKLGNPYITTDFSESQVEVVTPTYTSMSKVHRVLTDVCDIVNNQIGEEYFWPQSMPCHLPEDSQIPIASYGAVSQRAIEAEAYRHGLSARYGSKKQLISGVHINFSFTKEFIEKLHRLYGQNKSYKDFKDHMYLKMVRNFLRYRWLVIYLTGTSSTMHETYIEECVAKMHPLGNGSYIHPTCISFRNSNCGYKNEEPLYPSYESIQAYTSDVRRFVARGDISAPKELYTQIRMKAKGVDNILESLEEDGIKYLEIRTVDLNPFELTGLAMVDLAFIHSLMLYTLLKEESTYPNWQPEGVINEERVAVEGLNTDTLLVKDGQDIKLKDWALEILSELCEMNQVLNLSRENVHQTMINRVQDPKQTYAYRIQALTEEKGYIQANLDLAKKYKDISRNRRYGTQAFQEYELSTQILIKECLNRGIHVTEVDPSDNFLLLESRGIKHYVKQANKTALDNYITVLAMENKVVTKQILKEQGIPVPEGIQINAPGLTEHWARTFAGRPVVVKPKSTNYGLGISILDTGGSVEDIQKAVDIAFEYDNTVLVEEFLKGQEYRFLVIDDELVAVLKRVAANVVGDGKHTVRELATLKNRDPRRGEGYEKPLKKIKFDEQTLLYLKLQGLTPEHVPEKGVQIFLRGNSNISTGGDSVDVTDVMPQKYKDLAVRAARAVGAVFCGVDIMIEDIDKEDSTYGIIELNFNPSTDMHAYPYQGTERPIAAYTLKALGLIDDIDWQEEV